MCSESAWVHQVCITLKGCAQFKLSSHREHLGPSWPPFGLRYIHRYHGFALTILVKGSAVSDELHVRCGYGWKEIQRRNRWVRLGEHSTYCGDQCDAA